MPDLNFGIGFTIFFPQGDGGAEYEPITSDGVGFRTAEATGTIEYPSTTAFGGDRIHFSTGFVAERRPQTPTVCLDAVSIVEWRSNAQWKRASDKCKPTP